MSTQSALIAQIGRTVGLWGDLKFHLHTDFPEQFKTGTTFKSSRGDLTISEFNEKRGTIRFIGHESIDSAKKLTNVKIYADEQQSRANCNLNSGQYFWFDVIGCIVKQDNLILGKVTDIQRMGDTDYLAIETDSQLLEQSLPKNFLLPYIEQYIIKVDIEKKSVYTQDAKYILEAS